MAKSNDSQDLKNKPQNGQPPETGIGAFFKFGALVVGLIALAYVLMKVLAVIWPE